LHPSYVNKRALILLKITHWDFSQKMKLLLCVQIKLTFFGFELSIKSEKEKIQCNRAL